MPIKIFRKSEGFTYTEIMVVLGIISLLTLIAAPNYLDARKKTVANICISNQKMIFTAATSYVLNESDSLEEKGHKERLEALVEKGYLKGDKWCECPASGDGNKDDYTIFFENGCVADVECDVNQAEHKWP